MKGLYPLLLGLFATFAFSWIGLALIPNAQIGHLDPQMDEEGTDIYPMPPSGMAVRGQQVYVANGCYYCHSQQVRPGYVASDPDRVRDAAASPSPGVKWADRRSAPRDYIFAGPALIGRMRLGPDLANIGKAAPTEEAAAAAPAAPSTSPAPAAAGTPGPAAVASPAASASPAPAKVATAESKTGVIVPYSAAWHHHHLYAPRSLNMDSNMPSYKFLYETRRINGQRSTEALQLAGDDAPPVGYEVVPSYEARCLVAYLMSLDQSHPLKEIKPIGPTAAAKPAASPAASPAAAAK